MPQEAAKAGRSSQETKAAPLEAMASEVLRKAAESGLLNEKGSRITGRVSNALVEKAKLRTGIQENTRLIEFALASLALEDDFAETFKSLKGAVSREIKLGF